MNRILWNSYDNRKKRRKNTYNLVNYLSWSGEGSSKLSQLLKTRSHQLANSNKRKGVHNQNYLKPFIGKCEVSQNWKLSAKFGSFPQHFPIKKNTFAHPAFNMTTGNRKKNHTRLLELLSKEACFE